MWFSLSCVFDLLIWQVELFSFKKNCICKGKYPHLFFSIGNLSEDFKNLYAFIEEMQFDRLGIFTYSEEEGTLAESLKDDVSQELKNERKMKLMDLQAEISNEKNQAMVGKTLKVIIDDAGSKHSVGRTEYDSPEVDNIVNIEDALNVGEFYDVKIDSANEFELIGMPV